MKSKVKQRQEKWIQIIEAGPQPITEIVLLQGPWGECEEVSPEEYTQLLLDYGGHPNRRDNLVFQQGRLARAMGQGGRTKWAVAQVRKQMEGAYLWEGNLGLFYQVEPRVSWKHHRTVRLETEREVAHRALYSGDDND